MIVPFNNLAAQYHAQQAEIDAATQHVLESGWYILGHEVAAFEEEFAAFCGAAGAVGVNSGTDALQLALRAFDIGPGDEVITVSHTAVATVAAIRLTGATPLFVDIDPATYTLDPGALDAVITPQTRAVVAVHLYGQPAAMNEILRVADNHDLIVIEDCAQAHGATYNDRPVGTLGHAGCFSFYPTKNLGALGDGGAVVSRDSGVTERIRLLREYGWSSERRYVSIQEGINSRLDELQAAILRVKLTVLSEWNRRRQAIAQRYSAELKGTVHVPEIAPDRSHVFHLYVIRAAERDQLRQYLSERGIGTGIHYPVPVHRQPAYAQGAVLPNTERVIDEILSLPLHPLMSDVEVEAVIAALHAGPAHLLMDPTG